MKESRVEGSVAHNGLESCVSVREGGGEVLTRVHAGRVLSRETNLWGADALAICGRRRSGRRYGETLRSPARSKTPCMHGRTSCEDRDTPCLPMADGAVGRVGKSEDSRRR